MENAQCMTIAEPAIAEPVIAESVIAESVAARYRRLGAGLRRVVLLAWPIALVTALAVGHFEAVAAVWSQIRGYYYLAELAFGCVTLVGVSIAWRRPSGRAALRGIAAGAVRNRAAGDRAGADD